MKQKMQNDYEQLRRHPLLTETKNCFAIIIYQQGLASWIEQYYSKAAAGEFRQFTAPPASIHLQSTHFAAAPRPSDGGLLDEILPVWVDMVGAHLAREL